MLGGIDNGLFLQSFGGFLGLALLIFVLKWVFSSNRKMIVTPIKAGKKDEYGLLKPLQTPSNYIAESIYWSTSVPAHVNIDSLVIRPVAQAANHKVFRSPLTK